MLTFEDIWQSSISAPSTQGNATVPLSPPLFSACFSRTYSVLSDVVHKVRFLFHYYFSSFFGMYCAC
jgi:hypothetical protein